MFIDPDKPDARLVAELTTRYEAAARRLREKIISPPGRSNDAQEWNQTRAQVLLAQVDREIARLKGQATQWSGPALSRSMRQGISVADRQAKQAGIRPPGSVNGTFHILPKSTVELLAKDTVGDLHKAADSMRRQAANVLHHMAATGVTNAQVNAILTGGVIEGKPLQAIAELKAALKKVHGETVTITDKNGDPMEFKAGYYAKMVAVTKTREAACKARHARLQEDGIDLVVITGKVSSNFCTAYMDKIFSISGTSKKYPALSSLPGGGPPFHPNCSKGTAPFVEELADPEQLEAGKPDPDTSKLLNVRDRTELQRRFQSLQLLQPVRQRVASLRTDAGRKVALTGHEDVGYLADLLKKWGVENVHLNNDPQIGAMIVKGMQQVVSAGGKVPKSIVVGEAPFKENGKLNPKKIGIHVDGIIMLNPAWPGWRDGGKTMREYFSNGLVSSEHPLHPIYHESAHNHFEAIGADHHKAEFSKNSEELMVAKKVSIRATKDRDEFLAEVRAAKMAGRKFPGDVLDLYERLGGQ